MNELKFNLEAIRAYMKLTRSEMANRIGINLDRYNRLVRGKSKLLATEFCRLHEISGIPFEQIKPNE